MRKSLLALSLAIVPACDRGEESPAPAKEEPAKTAEKTKAAPEPKKAEPKVEAKVEPETKAEPPPPPAAPKELIGYVPEAAKLAIVIDAKAVTRAPIFTGPDAHLDKLRASRLGEVYDAAAGCSVGADTWSSLLIAFGDASESVVVARATGLGKKATLECLAGKINATATSGKWAVAEEGGRGVFTVEGRTTKGVGATDDVLVVYDEPSASAVAAILDGTGKSAADAELGRMLAAVDHSRHVYFGGTAPPGFADGMFADLKQLSGTVDFSSGIAVAMSLDFGDLAKAEMTSKTLNSFFEQSRPNIEAIGIPTAVLSSVKIEPKGTTVAARIHASQAELATIMTKLGGQL